MRRIGIMGAVLATASAIAPAGVAAQDADPRNVQLCHGSATGGACDTTVHVRSPYDEHEVTALVTDHRGTPVPHVRVQLRETGPAAFTETGASSFLLTTGGDGNAHATLFSAEFGTSTIVAEIDPPDVAGSTRGPAVDDDECEQPAGQGGSPPAGNCISQTLTVSWQDVHSTICSDGIDNDGDGLVDYPEDPGCTSVDDDSETPAPHPAPTMHRRGIAFRFAHASGDDLLVFGRLRLVHRDDGFRACVRSRPVEIQRRAAGSWETLKSTATNPRGRFSGTVADRRGRYRVVAVPIKLFVDDDLHVCRRADKTKPHRHPA
ncbi:MAG: hypothetical protein M3279_12780 [Actinomycetota bacterium]|nr:hypothetical protein [Actinomycetota bacterium]